jgi:hypothetical protein
LFGDGEGEAVPASGNQNDFNARGVRPPQRRQVALGNFELWIEQRAVDIGRQQPDGSLDFNIAVRRPRSGPRILSERNPDGAS